jgi:uncharacterized membrane protein
MKKLYAIGLFLMVILALGVNAVADVSLSTSSLTVSEKPTRGFSTSFTVNNNGTVDLTGLSVALTTTELIGFNVTLSPSSFNLANGSTPQVITVTGNVPEDVNTRLSPFSGTITVSGTAITSKTIALDVTANTQLNLDKVKAKVDGKSKSVDSGDTIKDVLPGDKVVFTGDIENLFSDDEDIEIEDVEIEIIIESIDDEGDDDLEDSEDVGDIEADDEESFSIEFNVPEDVEEGDYDVIITIEAEDENGAKHSVEWELTLQIEKDKHDVQITKASVSPSKVSCSRNIKVDVELKNQGRSDEDEIVLLIESADLEIENEDTSIEEIEEGTGDDTEFDKTYTFRVGDDVKAGTYSIDVTAYYDSDTESDSTSIDVTVEKCSAAAAEDEEDEEETVVVVSPPTTVVGNDDVEDPEILTESVTETTEISLFQSGTYLTLLIGGIGVAGIVVIVLVVMLFSMKRKQL